MNKIDQNTKMRKGFQITLIILTVIVLLNLYIPSSFNLESTGLLVALIIACVGLVFTTFRLCCKNVRKNETIIYYILNIVFVCIVVYCAINLSELAVDIARDKISHLKGTAQYVEEYDEIEGRSMTSMFVFVLFGFLNIFLSIAFALVGISITYTTKGGSVKHKGVSNQEANTQLDYTESNDSTEKCYCTNCGKQIDIHAKFCRYCGKEVK